MNLAELIQRVQDILGEQPQTQTQPREWSDGELTRAINSAYDSLWSKASLADQNWGLDYATLSGLSGIDSAIDGNLIGVFLPEDLGQIVYIEENVDPTTDGVEVMPTDLRNMWRNKPFYWPSYDASRRGWFYPATNQGLIFTRTEQPLDITKARVWFKRKSPNLVRFTASVYPDGRSIQVNIISGATLGTLSTSKDYYKNAGIECVSVTAHAAPERLKFAIAGYVIGTHPNYTITLDRPHTASGSTVWEVLPVFPPEHHELIAQLAAFRALAKGGDSAQRNVVGTDVGTLMDNFMQQIDQRQVQYPRFVNVVDD